MSRPNPQEFEKPAKLEWFLPHITLKEILLHQNLQPLDILVAIRNILLYKRDKRIDPDKCYN